MDEVHILSIVLNDVLSWRLCLLWHLGFCVRLLGYAHKCSITCIPHHRTVRVEGLTLHGSLRELHLAAFSSKIGGAVLVEHLVYTGVVIRRRHLEVELLGEKDLLDGIRLLSSISILKCVDLSLSSLAVLLLDQLILLNLLHLLL